MRGNWVRALKKKSVYYGPGTKRNKGLKKKKKIPVFRERGKRKKTVLPGRLREVGTGCSQRRRRRRRRKKLVRNLVRHFLQSSSTLLFTPKFLLFGHLEGFPHLTSLSHKHTRDKEEKDVKIK